MKILFVINSLKHRSGIERVACLLANLFDAELSCQVKIVNRDTPKNKVPYDLNSSVGVLVAGGGYYSFYKGVNRLIEDFNPNLILAHNMGRLTLLCTFLNKEKNVRLVSLEHVAFKVRPKWVRLLSKLLYKKIDQVVTLTQHDMQTYKMFHNNVVQINNISPFDVKDLNLYYAHQSKTIVSIGRLTYQKNFESLLHAWKIVSENQSDWILEIYGSGENQKQLESIMKHENIKNVYLKGQTTDVESVYRSAAFYVMSSRFEGLPMVLIEAQSFGLPIISYDCPHGPAEIIEHNENGFLVQDQNPVLLAESMLKLMSSDALRSRFSENAHQHATQYSSQNIVKDWTKVIS